MDNNIINNKNFRDLHYLFYPRRRVWYEYDVPIGVYSQDDVQRLLTDRKYPWLKDMDYVDGYTYGYVTKDTTIDHLGMFSLVLMDEYATEVSNLTNNINPIVIGYTMYHTPQLLVKDDQSDEEMYIEDLTIHFFKDAMTIADGLGRRHYSMYIQYKTDNTQYKTVIDVRVPMHGLTFSFELENSMRRSSLVIVTADDSDDNNIILTCNNKKQDEKKVTLIPKTFLFF